MAETATWVSLKEASARAGVSVSWLRKQYRQHGLPTKETLGPRGPQKAVPLEEVLARAAVFAGEPVIPPKVAAPAVPVVVAAAEPAKGLEWERSLVERLIEAERRAAQAEAEAAYLRLRLEDAFNEVEELRSTSSRTRQ